MVDLLKRSALTDQALGITLYFCFVFGCLLITGRAQAAEINLTQPSPQNLIADLHSQAINDTSNKSGSSLNKDSVNDSSAMKLFVSSGLKELVGRIPVSTASSFEAALNAEQLPDLFLVVDQEAVGDAVSDAFKAETFNKYLVQELNNSMSEQAREYMLTWYASALGTRVKQAEIDNSLLTEHARFDNYMVFLKHYPVDATREALIEKLDVTMKSTESAIDMMSGIQVAFNLSLTRFMPEEHRLSRQQILQMVEQSESELLSHYKEKTKAVLLFTYQALNDDDLALLNETLATDAGQDFIVATNAGIKKGMFAASLDLGDGLGALLDALPQNSGI